MNRPGCRLEVRGGKRTFISELMSGLGPSRDVLLLMLLAGLLGSGCGNADPAPVPPPPSAPAPSASTSSAASVPRDEPVEDEALPPSALRFAARDTESGIDFTYRNGQESEHYAILESLGGGVGLFDFDVDGRLDVFLPGGGGFAPGPKVTGRPAALFRQQGTWSFENVSGPARTDDSRLYSHGAAAADFDHDGFPDVLVTGYQGLLLFRNQGDGTFTEVAQAAGLTDALWSSSAAWGDVDGDGLLDVYVTHYVDWSFDNNPPCDTGQPERRDVCPPRRFAPLPDRLYRGRSDGAFADDSTAAGLRADGKGLGVVMADLNLDGRLDVYVGNDTVPNFLYENGGGGTFSETGLPSGTALSRRGTPDGSMGVDVGDVNLDGLPDLWVANYESESFALYSGEGDGFYRHVSQETGVTDVGMLVVGWGTAFFDADRDGDEDLVVANGHVVRHPASALLRQEPLLFENRLSLGTSLVNVAPSAGDYFASQHMGRGLAVGDLDNDGDLDVVVSQTNEPVAVLSNETPGNPHWIGLRLVGTQSTRTPIGTRIALTSGSGRRQTRQVKGGGSYASTSDQRVFFGLGDDESVPLIEVRWPSGLVQKIENPAVDRYATIVEGGDVGPVP